MLITNRNYIKYLYDLTTHPNISLKASLVVITTSYRELYISQFICHTNSKHALVRNIKEFVTLPHIFPHEIISIINHKSVPPSCSFSCCHFFCNNQVNNASLVSFIKDVNLCPWMTLILLQISISIYVFIIHYFSVIDRYWR